MAVLPVPQQPEEPVVLAVAVLGALALRTQMEPEVVVGGEAIMVGRPVVPEVREVLLGVAAEAEQEGRAPVVRRLVALAAQELMERSASGPGRKNQCRQIVGIGAINEAI